MLIKNPQSKVLANKKSLFNSSVSKASIVCLALVGFASGAVHAESSLPSTTYKNDSSDSFYVKANLGSTVFDTFESDLGSVSSQSKVGSSFALSAGLLLSDLLGFELSHNQFGSTKAVIDDGVGGELNAKTSVSSNGLSILPRYPLGEKVSIYGEVGQHIWEADTDIGSATSNTDGSDIFYGFGFDYKVNKNIKAGFEFGHYKLDEASFKNTSVALTYQF